MSCYVCSDETISVLAKAFVEYGVYYPNWNNGFDTDKLRMDIAENLLLQNYASVNARYEEDEKPHHFIYKDIELNEGLVFGCLKNYDYQACETSDYYSSEIHYAILRLQDKITERLLKKLKMKAPWGYGCKTLMFDMEDEQ